MMSRVKQRVAIGCQRSPRAQGTVPRDDDGGGEGREGRLDKDAHAQKHYYTSIRHPPTRPRIFLLSNPHK